MSNGIACRMAALLILAATACGEAGADAGGIAGAAGSDGAGGSGGGGATNLPLVFDPDAPVQLTLIADVGDGLDTPRDLGFEPDRTGELWIVNRADDSVTIVYDATGAAERSEHRVDAYALHFMEEVSSIAFGADSFHDQATFGTCQESENTYNHHAAADEFMGPTLWSADLSVFAMVDPIGLGSHIDMLHQSPDCMGIAHDHDNVYWVFDGYNGRLGRYDFRKDHDAGYDDHSDGYMVFFDEPKLNRVRGVPSHMILDHDSGLLYIADTGGKRILRFDSTSGRKVADLPTVEDGTVAQQWGEATWDELIPAATGLLDKPSGIALHAGVLYVGDNTTGEILAFDLDGKLLGRIATGLSEGGLMGLEVGPDERLYAVDAVGQQVLRVERP